ncbi:MAG TPA: ATP-binding cassette domain-containing protein [Gaiellaceae bacterium]
MTALRFENVSVFRHRAAERHYLLREIDWTVEPGQQWAVLGPNGAGKTTLLEVASARMHPSSGTATILGGRLGRTSIPALRPHIAVVERRLSGRFFPTLTVLDVVLTGVTGTTSLLPEEIDGTHVDEARRLISQVLPDRFADRRYTQLSEGERARTMLARALIGSASLLVLDESTAGLDLGGRELFLAALQRVTTERPSVAVLIAGHHLEELPATVTHVLLLAAGRVVAAGPIETTLTDELLSACYGFPARVTRVDGRLFATTPS